MRYAANCARLSRPLLKALSEMPLPKRKARVTLFPQSQAIKENGANFSQRTGIIEQVQKIDMGVSKH